LCRGQGPGRRHGERATERESLHAIAGRDFRHEQIAFRVHGQVVRALEVSGFGAARAELIEDLQALAVHHRHVRVAVVGEVYVPLLVVG
jgi:hypothetical protein